MIKVLKFGGSSVNSAEKLKTIKKIIYSKGGRLLVVMSACRGITDKLYAIADAAKNAQSSDVECKIGEVRAMHMEIIAKLDFPDEDSRLRASQKIDLLISSLSKFADGIGLLHELTPRTAAAVVSFGELLSTTIFAEYLAAENSTNRTSTFCDARSLLTVRRESDKSVEPDFESTSLNCKHILTPLFNTENSFVITQGFIASDTEGHSAVLSRGGSDYSAAVFAAAFKADELEIWTDVSGIFTSDPRYYPNARTVPEMTYGEVARLSFFGAKVLHPDTVKPAVDNDIPLRVLNTLEPDNPGTLLRVTRKTEKPTLSAISVLQNISAVEYNIYKVVNIEEKLNLILKKYALKKYFSVSADTVSVFFSDEFPQQALKELPEAVNISPAFCICIAGNGLSAGSKPLRDIYNLLGEFPAVSVSLFAPNCIIITGKTDGNNLNVLYSSLHEIILKNNQ